MSRRDLGRVWQLCEKYHKNTLIKKKKKKKKELKSTNIETKVYIYKLGLGKSTDSAHHWVSVAQW